MENTESKLRLFIEDKIAIVSIVITFTLQSVFGLFKELIQPLTGLIVLFILIYLEPKFNSKVLKFFRSYAHIPLYGIAFTAFQTTVHKLNPADYDWLLLKADLTLFRFDITVWFQNIASRGLTEVLTLSYFSYYILPSLTFLLLFIQKSNEQSFVSARKYLLSIVIGWYAAFIFYIILPAAGPDIAFPEHYSIPLAGLSPITNTYLQNLGQYLRGSNVRNTFPSMHFAIILMSNYFAFRFRKKYFLFVTLPLGLMLGTATLYLRQHYMIDLVGSIPMAVIGIYVAWKTYCKMIKQSN